MKITSLCKSLFALILISFVLVGCKNDKKVEAPKTTTKKIVKIPKFDEENAYQSVKDQLVFGYRYPGTEGHKNLIQYIMDNLSANGAQVHTQDFKVDFLDVKGADATNIIGSYNPENSERVMLAAHFDSRMIADKDESKQDQPIMGADDGASGVAVLLEIARLIHENDIDLGVDLVFFDAEDQGLSGEEAGTQETWCLGSQYWGQNPHVAGYTASYGILLDMVGAKNAQFGKELLSKQNAGNILNKVWKLAGNMGYGNFFQEFNAGGITDDHFYVMKYRKFPMINIINRPVEETEHGFGAYHHTHQDNIDVIDKNTLKAVGKVVTATIYNTSMGRF